MDVERHLLCHVGTPMFVVEAVYVFAIFVRCKGMVAGGYAAFVYMIAARRFLNLRMHM